jgi:phosphoribosylanthranilate isomerase
MTHLSKQKASLWRNTLTKPFIKICGITRPQDYSCAIESGADAIGFIAYKKSPRYVSPERVKALIDSKSANVKKVVVVVNASLSEINEYLAAGVDIVQLHGSEDAEFASQIKAEVWKAIRLHESSQITEFRNFPCSKFVVDSFVKGSSIPGGTGHKGDWPLTEKFNQATNADVLLAGGICAENASEAIAEVNCFGLDLSSGVELEPGIKSEQKIIEFFNSLK